MTDEKSNNINYKKIFKIISKNENLVFFNENRAQRDFEQKMTGRDLLLKARQLGFSTLIQMNNLDYFLNHENSNQLTVCDTLTNAKKMFKKVKIAWDNLPEALRTAYHIDTNNVSELSSDVWNASLRVSTSGRSDTINRLHLSEFAYMTAEAKGECFTGSMQAVPKGGEIIIESTPNGIEEFYDLCKEAWNHRGPWKFHFYGWNWAEEYQDNSFENTRWKLDYNVFAIKYGLI